MHRFTGGYLVLKVDDIRFALYRFHLRWKLY